MVRYKRNRRYGRRRSTNVIKMKFQSFMDIQTSATSMQIITVSAGGPELIRRLAAQFSAYKYYKIGNIAVKLVPASTLPVDPTGLSLQVGEPGVDPRDQLTPGMMRITNGEDIFEDLTGLSDDQQHGIYNNMLLDPRWYKWMLQSGVKRHATPRYWTIGQLHQDKWPGAITNVPDLDTSNSNAMKGTVVDGEMHAYGGNFFHYAASGSSPYGFFQTGHRGVLGWLPTDGLQKVLVNNNTLKEYPLLTSPPEVEVMKIILPKAYKTEYYYRMFVTETVYFREPIVNFGIPADGTGVTYRPLDVFHVPSSPIAVKPDYNYIPSYPDDTMTGGNYGDD